MKKTTLLIMSIFMIVISIQGQNYKNLNVFVTDFFDPNASITVEALDKDPVMATDALINALVINGFKVISERVAKENIELINKEQVTDSTFDQNMSVGKTTYLKSVYVVTFNYQYRSDSGCGGRVMSNLSGQIVDLANEGQIVATFSFKQNSFEGKCTTDVMNALAKIIKTKSKK